MLASQVLGIQSRQGLTAPSEARWATVTSAPRDPKAREPWAPSPPAAAATVIIVQSLSYVRLFVTPWTAARQASLSITSSRSLLKFMSIKLVTPSNHLILRRPLLLLPSIFPSIRVFPSESALCIRWPSTGASVSASVLPMDIQGD